MPTYFDAASLAFGRRPFTLAEFRSRIGTERAAKLLHELKSRGLAERTGRGTYRLLAPDERPDNRSAEWRSVRETLTHAPLHMAWAGPSAVEAWTEGRYRVAGSPFLREFHIAIPKAETKAWNVFLAAHKIPIKPRRRIGVRVIVEPRNRLVATRVDGEPVVARDEVVKLIRASPATYAGAEELLAN